MVDVKEFIHVYEDRYEKIEGYWMDKWREKGSQNVIYDSPTLEAVVSLMVGEVIGKTILQRVKSMRRCRE